MAASRTDRFQALQRQISRLERRLVQLKEISQRYALVRAIIFFAGLGLSGAILYFAGSGWPLWLNLSVTAIIFGGAVYYHRQIDYSITRHEAWLRLKMTHIARMTLDWTYIPTLSRPVPDPDHPFEADLDLVGPHSLHHLLDITTTREGSRCLRTWLTNPIPDQAETLNRQRIVRELAPRFLFRDKLTLNATIAASSQKTWDAERLLAWLSRQSSPAALRLWLIFFGLLAVFNVLAFILDRLGWVPAVWPVTVVVYFGVLFLKSSAAAGVFHEAVTLQNSLRQLGAVAQQLETFSYRDTPHLKRLCRPFLKQGGRPSAYLSRISRVVTGAGLRENPFMWLALNAVSPWDFYVAYRLNQCKAELAQLAPTWLTTWSELEALSALANLAYLNPAYTFPTISAGAGSPSEPIFRTKQVGHPLLQDEVKVSNDFSISEGGEIAIITGSNMAGKSTFLRTIGLNLALAYAGGPVSAQQFQTISFRLFTAIKISDSVTNGVSYFYAEVKRLRKLLSALEETTELPLFYFIDEIFRGTNNRERLIGSQSYIRALSHKNGVGLISTHDLELIKLADHLPHITNYHFRDDIAAELMVFDYTLRLGPCPTTNALKIMALEGLPIEAEHKID